MPGYRGGSGCVAVAQSGITSAVMCDMDLGIVWKLGSKREVGKGAKVFCRSRRREEIGKFLESWEPERDDFALGYEEGDFVFHLRREGT